MRRAPPGSRRRPPRRSSNACGSAPQSSVTVKAGNTLVVGGCVVWHAGSSAPTARSRRPGRCGGGAKRAVGPGCAGDGALERSGPVVAGRPHGTDLDGGTLMRRVIAFLVFTVAAVAFAWWLAGLPGVVAVTIGTLAITAPSSLALLGVIVLFLLLYFLVRVLAAIIRLPARTRRMRFERQRVTGDRAVTRTLLALAGGDSAAARGRRGSPPYSRAAGRHAADAAARRLCRAPSRGARGGGRSV